MKKSIFKIIGITSAFLFVLFVCGSIYAYYLLSTESGQDFPGNIASFRVTGSSRIDPQTILESLDRGDTDVFRMESGIPENPQFIMPIEWTQAEFFEVAAALHQTVWKEPLDDWNLYRMNFFTNCKDNPKGFSDVQLFFYKKVIVRERKMYSVREILVDSEYGYVAWGGDTYYPPPLFGGWKVINLKKMTIPADEALNIAEAKVGMDFRMSVENECRIFVDLNPEVYNRYAWQVDYRDNNNLYNHTELWISPK